MSRATEAQETAGCMLLVLAALTVAGAIGLGWWLGGPLGALLCLGILWALLELLVPAAR